jgi:hypothetical protein
MCFLLVCFALATLAGCQNPGRFQVSQDAESTNVTVSRQVHLAVFYDAQLDLEAMR